MTWLILEMLLALGVIVGIMVWTLKTRTDTPVQEASQTERVSDPAPDPPAVSDTAARSAPTGVDQPSQPPG